MKESVGKVMVLCDTEEEYAQLMTEYLRRHKNVPWDVHTYTDMEELFQKEAPSPAMLVVAESAYTEALWNLQPVRLVVLSETGLLRWENLHYVEKYQQAENVIKKLLEIYMEIADTGLARLSVGCRTVFVGNYSPVHRSMQTSLALSLGQLLARRHPTLYLNFEHFAGFPQLVAQGQALDMADLLYFLNAQKERFQLRLQSMLKQIGNLDYVPPMKSGQNLLTVTTQEWLGLFQKIGELGTYEYVILDLSESMQGLFEILRLCARVYTTIREDRIAQCKLLQYEHLLGLCEYGDVLEKTQRLNLPRIRRLPEDLEQLTKGDLAALAGELIAGWGGAGEQ